MYDVQYRTQYSTRALATKNFRGGREVVDVPIVLTMERRGAFQSVYTFMRCSSSLAKYYIVVF